MNFTLEQVISMRNYSFYQQGPQNREVAWIAPSDYHTSLTPKKENKNSCDIGLVDPKPLTRLSLSELLTRGTLSDRALNDFTVLPFSNCHELLAQPTDHYNKLRLVIFNIGTVAVIDEQLRDEIRQIRAKLTRVPLAVLCDSDEPSLVLEAIHLKAQGFITTSLDLPLIVKAIHLIAAGGMFVPNSILLQILKEQDQIEEQHSEAARLVELADFTPRQLEVLRLLWRGKSNKVIAYELKTQESTVKVHVREIMRKLNATNRTHAVFLASRLLEAKEGNV